MSDLSPVTGAERIGFAAIIVGMLLFPVPINAIALAIGVGSCLRGRFPQGAILILGALVSAIIGTALGFLVATYL